jgi:Phage integrase, N-terminal SAM-like domain
VRSVRCIHGAGAQRKTLYGKTRQEVAAKLANALTDREGGLIVEAGSLTLGDYLDRWLADSVRNSVRYTSYVRYEGLVHNHIKPARGRIKLKGLIPTHVRSLYREKLDAGLASRTVNYVHTTLHKALKQAMMDGLIPRNVTEAVNAPRQIKREVNSLSPIKPALSWKPCAATGSKPPTSSPSRQVCGKVRSWDSSGRTSTSTPVGFRCGARSPPLAATRPAVRYSTTPRGPRAAVESGSPSEP